MNKVEHSEIPMLREAKGIAQGTLNVKRAMQSACAPLGRAGKGIISGSNSTLKFITFFCLLLVFSSCNFNAVVDTNQSIEDSRWLYANATKADFEIKDISKAYQVNFKLRINTEYRYSNLFVLATFKDTKSRKKIRYQFKLAKEDGQWLGKGSGDLYTYSFPLLRNHRFTDTGKYSIEVEQNMRDNPLLGISDVGIEVK